MAETPKQPKDQPKQADRLEGLPKEFDTLEQLVAKYEEYKKALRLYVAEPRGEVAMPNGTTRVDY